MEVHEGAYRRRDRGAPQCDRRNGPRAVVELVRTYSRLGDEPVRRHRMKILLNTDHNVQGSAAFSTRIQTDLEVALTRFEDRLTRLEVHLGDESAGRTTGDDFRCLIEARPAGADPVTVTHHAGNLDEAVNGATDKLVSLLSSKFDRLESRQSRETIRDH